MSVGKRELWGMLTEIKHTAQQLFIMSAADRYGAARGARRLVEMYNQCRANVEDPPDEFDDLFPELGDEASLDEVWSCAAVLARYLFPNRTEEAPQPLQVRRRSRRAPDSDDGE